MATQLLKRIAFFAAGFALASAVGAGISSCNSSSAAALDQACSINTDCNAPLICAFARCHQACRESRDCTTGQRCVKSGTDGVCQLPTESTCAGASCQSGQVCGTDQQCRAQCSPSVTCSGSDICATIGTMSACYATSNSTDEIVLIGAGILAPDGAVIADGSAGMGDGISTGSDAEGGGGSGDATMATGGDGGDATMGGSETGPNASDGSGNETSADTGPGMVFNPCPAAQEQFGFVAQGDVNPNYTSGVGVRTATQLLIFNGYVGPPVSGVDAGDAGSVNLVFVHAFDPATAASLGAPSLLFRAPDGAGFTLMDVSISPSGNIALAFAYAGFSGPGVDNRSGNSLSAAFLAPAAGGTGGLKVGYVAQVESGSIYGQPHVIWSVANQAFLFSWELLGGTWTTKIAQFLSDGRPASGAGGVVPTDSPAGQVLAGSLYFSGAAGTSGGLVGVGFISNVASGNSPFLTILDSAGNQVGSSIRLAVANTRWIATAGTAQGFVTFYDNGTAGAEAFVPISVDGGVADGGLVDGSADAGPVGPVSSFVLPGAAGALDVRAIGDDTGGQGGVGAALLYSTQVGFAYVNANGQGPLAHFNPVLPHTYVAGDFMTISNYRGIFAVSLYDNTKHATQMIASGCQ
jgi:hypothetical protein